MRSVTLDEVRQLLSTPAAMRFFEAWVRASSALSSAKEHHDSLAAQVHAADSRVVFAQERARQATLRADHERRRALELSVSTAEDALVRLEAEALSQMHLARARAALDEARERRLRANAMTQALVTAQVDVDAAVSALRPLRDEAASFGAHAGDCCLFFGDASVPGAVFVVPLERLTFDDAHLDACVLHRHPGRGPLSLAEPVRHDTRDEAIQPAEPVVADDDGFATPSEQPRGLRLV